MWLSFLLSGLCGALFLYLPGFFIGRCFRFSWVNALCAAPVLSLAVFFALIELYYFLGVPCSWLSVFFPVALASVVVYLMRRAKGRCSISLDDFKKDIFVVAVYLIIGCAVCMYVYILPLDGADAFYNRHDMITHVNYVRSFAESGVWSSIHSSAFWGTGMETASYTHAGFYPALWHSLVAMVVSMTGAEVMVAINATNALVTAVVFPLSVCAFVRALFPGDRRIALCGAFVAPAFTAFPWAFFLKGPLYPNMLGNSLLPSILAIAIKPPRAGDAGIGGVGYWVFGVAAFFVLAFSQTNTLFSALVFLYPFVCHEAYGLIRSRQKCRGTYARWKSWAFVFSCVVLALAFSVGVSRLPFLSNVVNYENKIEIYMGLANASYSALSFSFYDSMPDWVLAVCALIGAVFLVSQRRTWLLVPASYMMALFVASRVFFGYPKLFFTGFWYSDPHRLAGCAALFLIPIAALGLSILVEGCIKALGSFGGGASKRDTARITAVGTISVLVLFSLLNFCPNYEIQRKGVKEVTAFGYMKGMISRHYTTVGEWAMDRVEEQFLDRVKEIVPHGSLIINQPNDGSMFAYGTDGLNLYYRNTNNDDFTNDATVIREGLYRIADDEEVQRAVKELGAKYVLQLDHGVSYEDGVWMPQYSAKRAEQWAGIDNITDSTPGFKVLLAEGDMRLYEIVEE